MSACYDPLYALGNKASMASSLAKSRKRLGIDFHEDVDA